MSFHAAEPMPAPIEPSMPALSSSRLTDAGFAHGFSTRSAATDPDKLRPFLPNAIASVVQVHQVHGAHVFVASGPASGGMTVDADAIVASGAIAETDSFAIGVRVADCVPILVGDPRTRAVAAIHAGWRGTVAGVVRNALDALSERGGSPGRAVVALGPSIGPCCFEVDLAVAERIAASCPLPQDAVIVRQTSTGKAMVNLAAVVRAQLVSCGVEPEAIDQVGGCTRCDARLYFSFRRDGSQAGRHLGFIVNA